MFKEFKAFIMRGNVVDLAVGVIIGAAFKTVVDSLVANVFTPLIGLIGGTDFRDLNIILKHSKVVNGKVTDTGLVLGYGQFFTDVISFVLIAAAVFFFVVKPLNALAERRRRGEEEEPPKLTNEEVLLTEIRDLLQARAT
ncbi:MAG: large conductance mechanosensitive channel [Acidimicrobiaceae bacterium]|jgi:large conductance mechanosensitive channel